MTAVLRVEGLKKLFPVRRGILQRVAGHVKAVDGVSFSIEAGETLCLVGESGCGKSTVGKTVLRLMEPSAGQIWLGATEVTRLAEDQMRVHRREAQMVFQDPYSSLNPRMRAGQIIAEPLENYGLADGAQKQEKVAALLEKVKDQDPNAPLVSTLALEKEVNTFFRLRNPTVIAKLREAFPDLPDAPDPQTVFVKLRELRNTW